MHMNNSANPLVGWQKNVSTIWRCPRKGCQTRVSIRAISFFSQTKLTFCTILKLLYLWSRLMRVADAAAEVKVSPKIRVDWSFNTWNTI